MPRSPRRLFLFSPRPGRQRGQPPPIRRAHSRSIFAYQWLRAEAEAAPRTPITVNPAPIPHLVTGQRFMAMAGPLRGLASAGLVARAAQTALARLFVVSTADLA